MRPGPDGGCCAAVDGRRRQIGLGSAQLVRLADARDEAVRLRCMARAGEDPLLARPQARQTVTPETARRVKQRIKRVLDWAKASGFRHRDNPVDAITSVRAKVSVAQGHHAALPYARLPAFIPLLRTADSNAVARLAFEFLILTATAPTKCGSRGRTKSIA